MPNKETDRVPEAMALFDVIELPNGGGPAHFAVAIPGKRLRQMPGFPGAALPEAGRMASGRGLDAPQCRASSVGEAVELASCCAWGDERLVAASLKEIGAAALPPEALNGFDRSQVEEREAWNAAHSSFDWRPAPLADGTPIDWIEVEDAFGGAAKFAPTDFVFIGLREVGDSQAAAIGDSNGCAAGEDAETAKTAAVLELVERDATARWWYGRRRRAPIDIAAIEGAAELTGWLAGRERRSFLFDITTDLDIPVIAAMSAEPNGCDIALGFAARLDPHLAAISALTEMLQMEVSLSAARALGDAAGSWAYWLRTARTSTPPLDATPGVPSGTLLKAAPGQRSGLSALLDACARRNVDLCFADMTRPAIGVPVFRALSTALCHYKPRFARSRLLDADPRDLAPAAQWAGEPWLVI
ncbi:YcaO-like family protein [Allomesorhizobium camelthorni]|uniref:YcaO-like family protein n=1 Tax=Allomesorhizobium camelthorni TaxID=475069 RepID=A0A6G4WLQ0_9HYPH|nr:YcaO-like family protein [Mesorhizobium camelthorni]NGO55040.1 YcaO-like family protein [Mesorhizobium camelthorni]